MCPQLALKLAEEGRTEGKGRGLGGGLVQGRAAGRAEVPGVRDAADVGSSLDPSPAGTRKGVLHHSWAGIWPLTGLSRRRGKAPHVYKCVSPCLPPASPGSPREPPSCSLALC